MPELVADFHLHSRYSRATSRELTVSELAKWAKVKGVHVLGTGDFTHPLWMQELGDALQPTETGLYEHQGAHFILTVEVNTLFYRAGRAHQIHVLMFAPSLEAARRINRALDAFGNLSVDGRPTLRLEPAALVRVALDIEPRCLIVPAHAWTPHFSIFGANSGFDTVEECFGPQTKHIYALETGLSSDPAMNWRLSQLDRFALISNSDAHSGRRIGREANVFACERSYDGIVDAIKSRDPQKFLSTLEFFPEEGKYHFDGHRNCQIRWSPADTRQHHGRCPVCGRPVTVGVMHRVEVLADRPADVAAAGRVPFQRLVPLDEIIAEALGVGAATQTVEREYQQLVYTFGTELNVLLKAPEEELRGAASAKIVDGILRMRQGRVFIQPGYDGQYGTVHMFSDEEPAAVGEQQMTLF